MTGTRPLIGITSYLDEASWGVWRQRAALLPHTYVAAVTTAGATAVLLPPQPDGAEDLVARLDGLVVAGGPDVDPARYRATADPRTDQPHTARDSWELELLRAALGRDLPVLGVCRGMQLLNVALGGRLVQHLPDRVGDASHQPARAVFGELTARVRPGSLLGGIVGDSVGVRCYHHQAVAELGAGLRPTAWSEDETVEAIELPDRRFVLGVQWHPETDPGDPRLFGALVAQARTTRAPAPAAGEPT
ncbi:gamma-glutamyl-gamma-aminobutyrate hydrolase family protein [Streptacidiphilus sp. P02-A3a]|uniref:gamma-glutamyl-gamma-aminobutyrate hydrolase family protein n=1 Tax=Streptacidiphilus sp. P02-A3a TaxID=2704468 RepID=UPI0015FE1F74|nr:gamma-glutamyl-gamma-aminobutyrate hydrolase family protein [Streptacidiphilus sp. P02-A3a]QMU69498.1 gamma-glutamyl-gamma-aminobutyrate hydrolase family protein [Streptacidiphilus sp. P02-A3a]